MSRAACRSAGVSDATYYQLAQKYGGMGKSQLREMKELEKQNTQLKKIVAELELDKLILKESLDFLKTKGLTKDQLRQAVIHTRQKVVPSERHTCTTLGVPRSTQRYQPAAQQNDDSLRLALIRLAMQYGRYGYRKIAALLRVGGLEGQSQES